MRFLESYDRPCLLGLLAIAGLAIPTVSSAQTCETYVGQVVTLNSFDAVAESLNALSKEKGEYETTVEYEARIASVRGEIPERVIILGIFSPDQVEYDADVGALKVSAYAMRNLNTSYRPVFGYGTPYDGQISYSLGSNRDVVVFQNETITGTYRASNAYGASTTVTEITRLQKAIFEAEERNYGDGLFVDQTEATGAWIGSVTMTIPEAKAIKSDGKVAFVVAPKWPYYAEGERRWEPRIDRPRDIKNPIQVIVGDIQCGLLLTANDTVVSAFETR